MEISKIKIPGVQDPIDIKDTVARQKSIEITWADLKDLRDNSELTPGQWYRITDYTCTTTQTDTQSAGHVFDIIVRADDVNVLNENAFAAHHAGDTYFANSKLEAWKLLYCLDNDTARFAWAGVKSITISNVNYYRDKTNDVSGATYSYCWLSGSTKRFTESETPSISDNAYSSSTGGTSYSISSVNEETGKGVIFYMKDENDNECPYDFKNIQFKVGAKEKAGTVANVFYYTFSVATGTNDATVTDHSLNGFYCYDNRIGKWITNSTQKLNFNVFRNTSTTNECQNNTFGNNCKNNTFGDYCNSNTFGNKFQSNTFRSSYNNTFGVYCSNNTFGNCNYNTFGDYCSNNTFGNGCNNNTFLDSCQSNTFGNNCNSNTFGNEFQSNTFGNECQNNTFGNECQNNTFGNNCKNNTFGDYCKNNTFGYYCNSNTFGNECYRIKLGTSSATKNYCGYIIIENGNRYLYLDCSATTSSSAYFQNVKIAQGVNNTSTYKTITHTTAGDTFQTVYKPANSVEVSV